jgi:hypothetical protein
MTLQRLAGVAAVALAALGGGAYKAIDDHAAAKRRAAAEAQREASEWQQKMEKASAARHAISARYASCVITNVVDTHTSMARSERMIDSMGLPYSADDITRNKVVVTAKAVTTPESAVAEAAYANGTPDADLVRWYSFRLGGVASVMRQYENGEKLPVPIPDSSTSEETGPHEQTFTVTLYPRTDKLRTTNADISLYTYVETQDPYYQDVGATYTDAGRISCGSIVESPVNGVLTWQIQPGDTPGLPKTAYQSNIYLNK